MGGNVTIFFKVIMEMPYYFLCLIPLNEGKTSRMALPKKGSMPVGRGSEEEGDKRTKAGSARKNLRLRQKMSDWCRWLNL